MANKYFREYLIPSAATETAIYTVPAANAATVRSLRVTNANAASALITVIHYESGGVTAHYLLKAKSLAANGSFDVFNGVPLNMEEGDVLKVTSSVATVTFYLSYLEMDRS